MRQVQSPPLLLDEGFDDESEFELSLLDSIRRCGTIAPHPNSWGAHDGQFARSDAPIPEYNVPLNKRKPRKERLFSAKSANPRPLTPLEKRDIAEKQRFDWAFSQLCGFPHCSSNIATETAIEFAQFGHVDASDRGITAEMWIWKRSRFVAGYR